MKDTYFAPVRNPMTIISLFVGLVEVVCAVALPGIPDELKSWVTIFLLLFPITNALLFYFVLIRYPQNFYGPQDFKDDQSFLNSLQRNGNPPPVKVSTAQEDLRSEIVVVDSRGK